MKMYLTTRKLYAELTNLGGNSFAFEMHRRFGGEFVPVAYRMSKWYKAIEELLDSTKADEFYKKFNGLISIYVGKMDRLIAAKRNEKIRSEYKAGVDYRILARKYNLTAGYLRKLLEHHPLRDRREKLKAAREKARVKVVNEV